ncbi:alpha/beta hydrolase [Brooklawnia cerclae]|uniref:Acetyl esterase/lipase n=1 Tax=Brooklawnia cerclae TaxID=349934 RepID=A0ABX0SE98_9ACTN|nr:alpha/beta hydrolase [Brooklawnia cerclae]NIH56705.1 acetyl esterase/lipase [Brooklawnia cerclae]
MRVTSADLHPELRRVYRLMPNPPVARRWQRRLVRAGVALLPEPTVPADIRYGCVDLGRGVRVHLFAPTSPGPDAALLWIHGGGMVIGSAAQDYSMCLRVVGELGIVVASVDYRLAPEHRFPAPLDDCHRAWTWLLTHAADYGVDPTRIAIGGQSAGGGLAAGLVQRVHDEGGIQPVAQWLFCPMLDDRTAANRRLDDVHHFLWDNRSNRTGWSAYLGRQPGGAAVPPYASPSRREHFEGLPATWIGAGDIELFYAEDRAYADALSAAGVDCTFDVVPGAPHAFESLASGTTVAREYTQQAHSWLGRRLGPAAKPS